jgi:SAM-dependent methyltransferase
MTLPIRREVYPEVGAGGFSSVDGIIEFYGRINAILTSEMTVIDFGAGRGKDAVDDTVAYRRSLRRLKGKARTVIGADIDIAIAQNPSLDSAVLIQDSAPLPFATSSVDLVLSDYTFEHVNDPVAVAKEIDRVLKPEGWICARTPNRWGYIALGATIVPNRLHIAFLRFLQPARKAGDVFPTRYRLNTRKTLAELFPAELYDDYSYYYDPEPSYFGTSVVFNKIARTILKFVPLRCAALLMVFKQKKPLSTAE